MADNERSDLQRAFAVLAAKAVDYTLLWRYYEGDQPLRFTTDRLREVFQGLNARFSENWCAVVIDAEHERQRLKEFTLPKPEVLSDAAPIAPMPLISPVGVLPPVSANGANSPVQAALDAPFLSAPVPPVAPELDNPLETRLNKLFVETELNLDADDVHLAALVTGEAYVFAWKDEEHGIEAYYHDPRTAHIFYDPDHPRVKQFAVKWWLGDVDDRRYLNLYYPDRIEYYVTEGKAENVTSASGFTKVDTADNPFNEIPLFHFRIDRRKPTSRLNNITELQDAINKLFSDMMVAAEFGAFRQRYVISAAGIKTLKNAPNEIWDLPGGSGDDQPTSAGEFSVTDLANYISAMDKLAMTIAIISRTPKHYVFAQGGDPSGEALIAMEAPLNKKAQSAIDRFKPTWSELGAFLLKLDSGVIIPQQDITPVFDQPETIQPYTEAQIRQIDVSTGIPLVTSLRREGWTAAEIAQMNEDKADAQGQQTPTSQIRPEDASAVNDTLKRLGLTDLMPDDLLDETGLDDGSTTAPA